MVKEDFALYATLKQQQKHVEAELERLQPELLRQMQEQECQKVDSEQGTFTISAKKKWLYTESVERLEASIKELKKTEQAEGTATYTESTYLVFRDPIPAGKILIATPEPQQL